MTTKRLGGSLNYYAAPLLTLMLANQNNNEAAQDPNNAGPGRSHP